MKNESPFESVVVDNLYKLEAIREFYPAENDETILALYNLDLEKIDKYGVGFSVHKTAYISTVINRAVDVFPQFKRSEEMLEPEYMRSAYMLVVVLHNIHKVTYPLISHNNLNQLYAEVLFRHNSKDNVGHSIVNMSDDDMLKVALNALTICERLGRVADETDYLNVIINLQKHYNLHSQWLVFTKASYSLFDNFEEVPQSYIEALLG